MPTMDWIKLAIFHPLEFRTLLNYKVWHDPARDITAKQEHETSGWDRDTMRRCWEFLDLTSRSFSPVIKELDGDLARTICMFYLTLRGLDTIEDDMTLTDDVKQPLLRNFYQKITQKGWTFDGSGPDEKDRQLLVEYDKYIDEMLLLKPEYREIIVDICRQMGSGMADYAHRAAQPGSPLTLATIEDYDLYCHYVAGLVGEGLSRLFSASDKEAPWIASQLTLSNSCGLLLQKTNILRDFSEDCDQNRFFWPKEIWGRYGFTEITQLKDPQRREEGLWALSGMTLDALRHVTDNLDYLILLKNQSVFNFVAIPATMAMATLALCFMNEQVLVGHVKIRKAEAVRLIMGSTNPRDVAYMCRDYARTIHAKAVPKDPNFTKLCVSLGKIEQWCEHHYPSFVEVVMSEGAEKKASLRINQTDARTRIVTANAKREHTRNLNRLNNLPPMNSLAHEKGMQAELTKGQDALGKEPFPWELYGMVFLGFVFVMGLSAVFVFGALYYFDVWDKPSDLLKG